MSFCQTNERTVTDNSYLLSRNRLSLGYVSSLNVEDDFRFSQPFFNVSYRSSGFDKFSSSFKMKFAFEVGMNGLIIASKGIHNNYNYSMYPVPYAKFGPELRIYKNLFVGGSTGLALIYFIGSLAPIPFVGLNCFYLIRLNRHLCLELESGFHMPYTSLNEPSSLAYLTFGVSID